MDDTAQDTGEVDAFARLLAQLKAPTTPPVDAVSEPAALPIAAPLPPTRAPELRGADELAAPPHPFPPLPVAATPLVAPPAPPVAPALGPLTPAPAAAISPHEFSQLLVAPASVLPRSAGRLPMGLRSDVPDEPDIGRSTVGEKLTLVVAILVPPLGLLAAIVGAILSARRRGWVIGVLRAALAIGVVFSIAVGICGYVALAAWKQQQAHDRTAAASAAFCATIKSDPTMISSPTFGWPAVGATITDSLAAMQAYEDKWTKLAKVSPPGIRPEVSKVAASADQIINSVTVGRTVNDASNISVMTSTASASGIPAWHAEYCNSPTK